jgi:hypothetical protein
MSKVNFAKIRRQTGYVSPKIHQIIPTLKNSQYTVSNVKISGEAPKDFICVYEYGHCLKSTPSTWVKYIAKVGHKWYPIESITEHLLNRIGKVIGLRVAESKLMFVGGQLRFLSKYFLLPHERLIHGAEIFSAYLEDREFVENVTNRKMEQRYFTYQFAKDALEQVFVQNAAEIKIEFVKMLIFDAITGNFDRHMYNWGVIVDTSNKQAPYFSPIYDTARGLFWNYSEEKLLQWAKYRQLEQQAKKYATDSKPKITWERQPNINQFDFVEQLFVEEPNYQNTIATILSDENRNHVLKLLEHEFRYLFSDIRLEAIKLTVNLRFDYLNEKIRKWES